jgi:hypothetical protein
MSPVDEYKATTTYKLTTEVSVQDAFLGEQFDLTFQAGEHTPKSEVEEFALQKAVEAQDHLEAKRVAAERRAAAAAAEDPTPAPSPPAKAKAPKPTSGDTTAPTPPDPED